MQLDDKVKDDLIKEINKKIKEGVQEAQRWIDEVAFGLGEEALKEKNKEQTND